MVKKKLTVARKHLQQGRDVAHGSHPAQTPSMAKTAQAQMTSHTSRQTPGQTSMQTPGRIQETGTPTQTQRLTLEQKRAQHAWDKAGEGISRYKKEYVNDAKGLPALIMNSGLMQIMAHLQDKGERQQLMGTHVRDWLALQCGTPRDFNAFMQHLFTLEDPRRFQAITAETFAWLRWLRQMAAARAGGE